MPEVSEQTVAPPQRAVRWTILLAALALIGYLCLLILSPFLDVIGWSAVLSITFYPVHERLLRRTGKPSLSALLATALVVVIILVPTVLVTGLAINQFLALRGYLQVTFKDGLDLAAVAPLHGLLTWLESRVGVGPAQIEDWLTLHAADVGRVTAGYSLTVAANVSGLVVSFVFTMFATFLLLRDGKRLVAGIPHWLPFERSRSQAILVHVRDVIYASVYGVVVIAAIQGLLCGVMFWILGIPSAALWGVVTVLTSVLPLVGAAAVWAPGAVYLLVNGHWPQAIVLAVWGAAVVSAVDNFLRPSLVGDRAGLSELLMFFALLGGLQVFGVLGIVLGPVVFAVAASVLQVLGGDPTASHD
jgi:predicted PurR-regulated permease PerM